MTIGRWAGRVRLEGRAMSVVSPAVVLVAWELTAHAGLVDVRFFPSPSSILGTLLELSRSGELVGHLRASLVRIAVGFLLGGIPAVVVGLTMGVSRTLRVLLNPLISALYPVPKIAILPLVLLVFGLGETSKIVIVAIGVFFLIQANTTAGVLAIEPIYFEVAKNYRVGRWNLFRRVVFPGALPFVLTGAKLGLGMGLIVIVAAEFVGAKEGIGYLIWRSWQNFVIEEMFVGLIVISLLGFVMAFAFDELERWVLPWRRRDR